ncbi:MAG: alpha-L-fucosidase [Planctomycetaceae bacterium]
MSNNKKPVDLTASPDGRWFQQSKFAMFVHWGPYAATGGVWNGKRYHGIGEWLMCRAQIPAADYAAMAATFNPRKFSADRWAALAAEAGMKYIVITAKHHDGFAMFKSGASAYNIADYTPFKRDPLAELAKACPKHGLKLGFYYSQFQDWHAIGGGGNGWDPAVKGDFAEYFNGKCVPQVEELMSNYGDVALIWFDTPGPISREDSLRLVHTVRRLQPQCLINSRIGNGVGDYDSLGDQEIPLEAHGGLWESIDTHNDTWGFVEHDHNWKSSRELVRRLVKVVAKGGNYMLNIGPNGLGEIPAASADILREVGVWTQRNAAAIYNAAPSPLPTMPWGECTASRDGKKLYLHVLDYPLDGRLTLAGLKGTIKRAAVLGRGAKTLKVSKNAGATNIALPQQPPAEPTVIVLDVAGKMSADKMQTVLPGLRNDFDPPFAKLTACKAGKNSWMEKFGDWKHADCIIDWQGPGSSASWTFKTPQAGRYYLELDYSAKLEADGIEGVVSVGKIEIPFPALDTGQRDAGVPDHGLWPLYRKYNCGIVHLPKAGKYTLTIRPTKETPSGWIMLKTVTLAPVPTVR